MGIGLSRLFTPKNLQDSPFAVTLPFLVGIGSCLILSVYCLASGIAVIYSIPISLAISIISFVVSMQFGKINFYFSVYKKYAFEFLIGVSLSVSCIFFAAHGEQQQPLRVGIDGIGYAITSKYLHDGGTLDALEKSIENETSIHDRSAIAQNQLSINFNHNISAEFLLKSRRWYPALLAALAQCTGTKTVWDLQFAVLCIPLFGLFGISVHLFRIMLQINPYVSIFASLAIILNCNFLNVLCEGQHAQIFSAPFLCVLFNQWIVSRNERAKFEWSIFLDREIYFSAFAFAVSISAYPEIILVATAVLFCGKILDVCIFLWTRSKFPIERNFLFAAFLGIIIAMPLTITLPKFYTAQVHNLQKEGGFWQPQWAAPIEIVGLKNMYTVPEPIYIGRNIEDKVISYTISIIIFEFFIIFMFKKNKNDMSVFLASPIFVILMYIKVAIVSQINNYEYMKAYTILIVPIMIAYLGAMIAIFNNLRLQLIISSGLLCWSSVVGIQYLSDYRKDSFRTNPGNCQKSFNELGVMQGEYIWILIAPGLSPISYAAGINMNILNLGWSNQNVLPALDMKVGFILNSVNSGLLKLNPEYKVLYHDRDIIFYSTGKTLRKWLSVNQIKTLNAESVSSPSEMTEVSNKIYTEFIHNVDNKN